LIGDYFLHQHILAPTRGKNNLDLVLSTKNGMVDDIAIGCPVGNSDHNLLEFTIMENIGRDG